jgi:hypothetical protein
MLCRQPQCRFSCFFFSFPPSFAGQVNAYLRKSPALLADGSLATGTYPTKSSLTKIPFFINPLFKIIIINK